MTQDLELTAEFKTTIQLLPLTSPDDEGFGSANDFIAGSGMPLGISIDPATAQRVVSETDTRTW